MRNRLTQDRPTLFVSQYGERHYASSLKELREKVGPGAVAKQYQDGPEGALWTGYIIGPSWFTAYHPAQVAA